MPAMMNRGTIVTVVAVLGLLAVFFVRTAGRTPVPARNTTAIVDQQRLAAADAEPENWFTGGRDQDGTY